MPRGLVLPDSIEAGPVRLVRRRVDDVPDLRTAIAASVDELARFLRWAADGVPTDEALRADVLKRDADFEAGTGFEFVLRENASRELVGEAGGDLRSGDHGAGPAVEIGYWLRTDRTHRGYASAAASALTSAVFASMPDVRQVELRMDKGNVASAAIAARLKFTRVGREHFDDEPLAGQTGEGEIWALTRAGWAVLSRPPGWRYDR